MNFAHSLKLIGQIAERFGVVVSQKTVAQTVPLVGAVSGAVINLTFTEHFLTLARGHFAVRRLERAQYEKIARGAGLWGEQGGMA